jgi:predicted RNA-binding protein with PIN domain
MSKPTADDRHESTQEELDPHRREEIHRVMLETADRLRQRGVSLSGRESSDELVSLLDAVEEYELAVERRGGDLMMDESPEGETPQPDDVHFALPRRGERESASDYLVRIRERIDMIRRHRPLEP